MKRDSGLPCLGSFNRRDLNIVVVALVGVVVLGGLLAAPVRAAGTVQVWFEDWNDGNAVNPPLDWTPATIFPGDYDASSGDYVLTGLNVQDQLGLTDNENEILAAVADSGDEFQSFSGQVSARTRAKINMPIDGQRGNAGVVIFANNFIVTDFGDIQTSAFAATVDDGGGTQIDAFAGALIPYGGTITVSDEDLNLPPGTQLSDVYVQLDNIVTPDSNATLSMTVWQPGEPQPAPQSFVDMSTFVDNDTGLTGQQILDAVPTEGPAGVVFAEDSTEVPPAPPGTPEGTGTFFWAMASSVILTNGDINLDGAINGLDVAPFVALVTAGTFDPLADMNSDGAVNGLDVAPFAAAVIGGATTAQGVPEPSTLVLTGLALLAGLWCSIRRR